MSNEEKKRRYNYRKKRKILILLQLLIIAIFTILTISFSLVYFQKNKTMYINYSEKSDVDYKVYLKPNEFYEEEYLGKNQAYVATLIDHIEAEFEYQISMEQDNLNYEYIYWVDAQLEITDKKSNVVIYNPTDMIINKITNTQNSSEKLKIDKKIEIDYNEYNQLANKFVTQYNLDDTINSLVVSMHINVISSCEDFVEDANNTHVVTLRIPLTSKTVKVEIASSIPNEGSKIIACEKGVNKGVFKTLAIILAILDTLLIIGLLIFIYVTRNTDINYAIKVKKIVNSYKSYIQKITNQFNVEGYQLLMVSTFSEMLDIRDTIQSPILMFENEDKTCTTFVIPTQNNLLYSFEIKVDDYDEIYSQDDMYVYDKKEVNEILTSQEKTPRQCSNESNSTQPKKDYCPRNTTEDNTIKEQKQKESEARKIIEDLHRDEIEASEVIDIVSDETAEILIENEYEEEIVIGTVKDIINLDTISKNYEKDDVVTINSLKEKKLINKNAYFIKVLARGILDKPLIVKAHAFSIDAAKMIEITGGRVIKLSHKK